MLADNNSVPIREVSFGESVLEAGDHCIQTETPHSIKALASGLQSLVDSVRWHSEDFHFLRRGNVPAGDDVQWRGQSRDYTDSSWVRVLVLPHR